MATVLLFISEEFSERFSSTGGGVDVPPLSATVAAIIRTIAANKIIINLDELIGGLPESLYID